MTLQINQQYLNHLVVRYADLTGAPAIPTDVSDLTDTTNLLDHVTPFSGDYNDAYK